MVIKLPEQKLYLDGVSSEGEMGYFSKNKQARKKLVVSVFANEPGILHIVLVFVFLTVLKNWKSAYEIYLHTFMAFPITGCSVVVHLSSVS